MSPDNCGSSHSPEGAAIHQPRASPWVEATAGKLALTGRKPMPAWPTTSPVLLHLVFNTKYRDEFSGTIFPPTTAPRLGPESAKYAPLSGLGEGMLANTQGVALG